MPAAAVGAQRKGLLGRGPFKGKVGRSAKPAANLASTSAAVSLLRHGRAGGDTAGGCVQRRPRHNARAAGRWHQRQPSASHEPLVSISSTSSGGLLPGDEAQQPTRRAPVSNHTDGLPIHARTWGVSAPRGPTSVALRPEPCSLTRPSAAFFASRTALHWAARRDHPKIVSALLQSMLPLPPHSANAHCP